MKRIILITLCILSISRISAAQLKSQAEQQSTPSQYLVHPTTGFNGLFGWFDPNKFSMQHNFSMSYVTSAGLGLSLASYTNSMLYHISDPLDVRMDVTLQASPFGSSGLSNPDALNSLYLSRAEVNYRPSENFRVQLQYRQIPFSPYGWWRSPYGSSLFGDE